MFKIQLLLAGDGVPAAVNEEAQRWRVDARPGVRLRSGVRIDDDPFASTAQGGSSQSFGIDGFLEAAVSDPADGEALRALAEPSSARVADSLDRARCAALVGVEEMIYAGDRPVLLLYALRRLPTLTHAEFCDHWLNRHAPFARATQSERGYRQFHVDLEASAALAAQVGFGVSDIDGVAEASYRDVADFRAVMAQPEVAADAMEDEKRFIDHSRSAGAVTTTRP